MGYAGARNAAGAPMPTVIRRYLSAAQSINALKYPGAIFALQTLGEVAAAGIAVAVFWLLFSNLVVSSAASAPAVDRDSCSSSCWDGLYKNGAR